MDELDTRVRDLDAERARPDVKPKTVEELLSELIGVLAAMRRTPPDFPDRRRTAPFTRTAQPTIKENTP